MAARRSRVDHSRLVEDLHARLDQRLTELATSDDWLDYLAAARRFHRYSPSNQLLLALQGAEGHVASYSTWQKIPATGGGTCQVGKGEKGLTILAPLTSKSIEIDDDTGEESSRKRLRGFRTVKVFHQGQLIDPPTLAEQIMPELLTGEDRWQHVWWAVAGRIEADGFDVAQHTRTPAEKWNGRTSWTDRQVLVADDLEPPQALKTLLHEWGHIELGHERRTDLHRSVKEVEAESVAYLLAQSIGLDSGDYSLPYIAAWAGGDISNVRRAAEQVLATTKRLVESLEIDLGIELAPDVVSRSVAESSDVVEIGSRILAAVPEAIPEPAHEVVAEAVPLPGFVESKPGTTVAVLNGETRRFLKAILDDLEPDQREHFMQLAFDRDRAGEAAVILAESGKSATQVGRVLDCLHVEPEAIRDALLYRVADGDRPTLFTVAETRAALRSIDDSLDLDDLVPLVERPTADDLAVGAAGEQVADLQLVQRALRRRDEPAKVAALAYGLDLQPAVVIGICRATGTEPSRAMAVAIAVRDGDARTAYHDVTAAWPDVEGGWEHHAHPSLRPKRHLAAVPDHDPAREALDRWTGRSRLSVAPDPSPDFPA
jgi:hypothetical protein